MKSFRTILRNKTAVGAAQQQQYNLHLKAHAEEVLLNSSNKSEEVAWFLGLAAASAAESRPQAINPLTHTTKHTQPQPHTTRHHKPYEPNCFRNRKCLKSLHLNLLNRVVNLSTNVWNRVVSVQTI